MQQLIYHLGKLRDLLSQSRQRVIYIDSLNVSMPRWKDFWEEYYVAIKSLMEVMDKTGGAGYFNLRLESLKYSADEIKAFMRTVLIKCQRLQLSAPFLYESL